MLACSALLCFALLCFACLLGRFNGLYTRSPAACGSHDFAGFRIIVLSRAGGHSPKCPHLTVMCLTWMLPEPG